MAFELKQNLRLSQQLIMTPQLQQAIKLLQLSRLELVDTINQEMEENPLLEETLPDDGSEDEVRMANEDDVQSIEKQDVKVIERTEEITGEGDGREEFDWSNYLEDYGPVGVTYDRKDAEAPAWDNIITESQSLTEHLMWQMKLSPFTEEEVRVGSQIVGNLDQNGYLCATVQEISQLEQVAEEFVEAVLKKVQEFDPAGVAARDLQECLLIQARMLGVENQVIEVIIKDHLKDLELKNYVHIARKLKIPLREVENAVLLISNMEPKPGSMFSEEKVQSIIPDVYVVKSGDEYKIILNDDGMPRLRISNFYREVMAGVGGHGDHNEEENGKKYIREKVQSATWLIKSIQQRQKTIYKVAESIVKFQRDFFDRGISFLKPLILRDVADDVEMHESTISRVVTNKYMHSPRGIFEMKYFFGSSIQRTTSGETIASKSVKEEIKNLVSQEDPKKPYSDCEIVDLLEKKGINIARRTVAKYREMMGVLPSSKRKKYF
ncbi:MAG: RNA polymerase sigma-54 factor [Deltaproteobacteria bacterium HGW-Deltaproteobacteria-10]|nr:MAG: RNA polymerase sigma-54 factor [Deltaproteobacteria bacterium HGW-Deltaproteobacteria-10]